MLQQTDETMTMLVEPASDEYHPRPLSAVLRGLAAREGDSKVTIRCIREALAGRSFAAFLIITCLINMLPFPPGSTIVLGIPIVIVAMQMVLGRNTVWLPEFFLKQSLSKKAFEKLTTKIIPALEKLESYVKPRAWPFPDVKSAEKIIGIWALILGIAVILPVPLGNWFPAFACAICGAALSERDGRLLFIGVALGAISIAVLIGMVMAIHFGVTWIIGA